MCSAQPVVRMVQDDLLFSARCVNLLVLTVCGPWELDADFPKGVMVKRPGLSLSDMPPLIRDACLVVCHWLSIYLLGFH